jgi:metallo-beta-lactamase family protein
LHGATRVEINGAALDVKARVDRIEGVSGHADADDLLEWLRRMPALPKMVALNHGAEQSREALASDLRNLGVANVLLPTAGQQIEVK